MSLSLIKAFQTDVISVCRRGPGQWIQGRFQPGDTSIFEIICSAQPLLRDQVLMLPEARRTKEHLNFYVASSLYTTDEQCLQKADIVTHRGNKYEIHEVGDWTRTDLPHYRAVGVKMDGEGRDDG